MNHDQPISILRAHNIRRRRAAGLDKSMGSVENIGRKTKLASASGEALIRADLALTSESIYHAPGDKLDWSWDKAAYARIQGRGAFSEHYGDEYEADETLYNDHGVDSDESSLDLMNSDEECPHFSTEDVIGEHVESLALVRSGRGIATIPDKRARTWASATPAPQKGLPHDAS